MTLMSYETSIKLEIFPDDSYDVDNYRKISVSKYETDMNFDLDKIINSLECSFLKHGNEFGCIQIDKNEISVNAMFGKVGDAHIRSFGEYSGEEVPLRYYKIKDIIKETMHIDHVRDKDGKLELIMYGGSNIGEGLIKSLYKKYLGISRMKLVEFDENTLRKLCFEKYIEMLYDLKFDPGVDKTFGDVRVADYKSQINQTINYKATKIQEIISNKNIKIQKFKSKIIKTHESLNKSYDIKFVMDIEGNITLEFPQLKWNEPNDSIDVERNFYNFARTVYNEIVSVDLFLQKKQTDLFTF